jgi:S-(hydroxymethyl)glutathione dehydrogenase/alcohol dehydrogenase
MRAALLTSLNAPLELVDIEPSGPDYGQVLVRITASGICGAQLQEIRGEKGNEKFLPHPLGHEGVGIVEAIGIGVTTVAVGDKVICHWRCGAGIESDFPKYLAIDNGQHEASGTRYCDIRGGKVTTFQEKALVSENRCTRIDHDVPDELACLLGCSLSTALGTIEHEAKLLMGESVLIIGCGGLGLNLIVAAKIRGASVICAVDLHEDKRESAVGCGATDFVSTNPINFPAEGERWPRTEIHYIAPDARFDVIIDTTGSPMAINTHLPLVASSGRMVLVGQPPPGGCVKIENARHLFDGTGKTIMATQGGRFNPATDVPRYIAAWRAGFLKIDGIITHRFSLPEINDAIELVRSGQAGRVLITMP